MEYSYFIILFLYIICFLLNPIFSKLALNYVNQYELFYAREYLMLIYLIVYFFIRGLIKKPVVILNLYQKLIEKRSNISSFRYTYMYHNFSNFINVFIKNY